MKLNLSEEPKEWRKSAWLTALGLAILSTVMRWRHVLSAYSWPAVLGVLAAVALCAGIQPRWFRGYYRCSMRLGFALSQFIGCVVLLVLFLLVVTPLGWMLRLAGKDPLQLKHSRNAGTFWHQARDCSPLDRLY